jgi:hypothetical protein
MRNEAFYAPPQGLDYANVMRLFMRPLKDLNPALATGDLRINPAFLK